MRTDSYYPRHENYLDRATSNRKRRQAISLCLALFMDLAFGDPPNRYHPVAWMGSLIQLAKRHRPHNRPRAELAFGAMLASGGSSFVAGLGCLFQRLNAKLPFPLPIIGEALLLKLTFSLRSLNRAATEVEAALDAEDLPSARNALGWSLVSRDVSVLNAPQIASAVIESLAENASDSIIAPLFYYLLGGLPLALTYRFVNTADAMLGYHTPEYEWLGKAPARLDDLLNLAPARLTGMLIVLTAPFFSGKPRRAWQIMRREAIRTESPNAGYPMSAMAGALGVELEKTGNYLLGVGGRKPGSPDIRRARRVLFLIAGVGVSLFLFLLQLKQNNTRLCCASRNLENQVCSLTAIQEAPR